MKLHHVIFFLGSFLLTVQEAKTQTPFLEIPLGLEEYPRGKDSFIPYYRIERPKIALALSGGGSRGLAQIGVLKVFERHGLPMDGIAGTSMGAIIGGLFSLGYSAAEIESLSYQIQWDEIIQDTPPRKQLFLGQKEEKARYIFQVRLKGLSLDIQRAYTSGQRLTSLITDLVLNAPYPSATNFNDLYIPFKAVATDLLTGEKVVLNDGSLIDALRASMAIPLLFTPVRIDSATLVDGGLVQNLPVDEAQSYGFDLVIAVDTSSKLRDSKSLNAPWEIADQVTTIMQQDITRSQFASADISIQPILNDISNTDFHHINACIKAGEEAAERVIPAIEQALAKKIETDSTPCHRISKISVSGFQKLDPKSFLSKIPIDTVSLLSQTQITWAGQSLFQSGYFQRISAFLDTSNLRLTFRVVENPFIEKIVFAGNQVFSDSLLLSCMESRAGEVLNIQKGRRDLKNLVHIYHRAGYVLAHIDSIGISNHTLKIHIDEGPIDKIRLVGNDHTRPLVILRELPLKPGDLFNDTRIRQGIDNIYSTGYFEGVRFDVQKKMHSNDLIIYLIERGYTLLRTSFRYDLERRSQGSVEIVEENLFGLGGKGSLTGLVGKRDQMAQVRFWSDRFLNTYLTYRFNLSIQKHNFYYYNDHKKVGDYQQYLTEGSLAIGQQMRRLGTLSLQIRSEKINLKSSETVPNEKFTLRNITLRSEVDTRDKVPFPQTGKYHILEYETAGRFLGSKVSYTKIYSSMESYYSVTPFFTFHPRICWGTADPTTPFSKQFRLGGLDSFMGMPEECFVGRRFIQLNGELRCRMPLPKWMEAYFSIRYDFGGIWSKYQKISTKDFKQGIGAILSFNTPLGPLVAGYGHMSDGFGEFYFSAGYRF